MIDFLILLSYVLLGTVIGSLLSLIPSLHIYNVAGIVLIIWSSANHLIPLDSLAPFFTAMIVAFSIINTIPMTFINAPDESASVTILPGNKYMMSGKGFEAAILSGIGGLVGLVILALLTPFFFYIFPYIHLILSPHMHWILCLVIVYMLMSEWPKGTGKGNTIFEKFMDAWGNLFAGLLTFTLSAILGLIITTKSIISPEMGFQNIMPVFVGLFAIPSIFQNLLSRETIPKQFISDSIDVDYKTIGKSAFQGTLGGLIAAYLPAVTAGIGGIIAGHATAQRGDKIFIVGGGVSKIIYYVGAFLFLFIITDLSPNGLGKGGLNVILKPVFSPMEGQYFIILSTIIFSGFISFLLLIKMSKWTLRFLEIVDYKQIYFASLILILVIIFALTGIKGFFVMTVASLIGSIPVFYHSRRSNCMAVLLVPITLNMGGYDYLAAKIFKLM